MRPLWMLLLFSFILTVPAAREQASSVSLQPTLMALAATEPDTIVPVIVQLQPDVSTIADALMRLGGKQTKELWIINAIVAEVPAGQLPTLAALSGVRWVSLDAPVVNTSCDDCIPADTLRTVYNQAINADELWNQPSYLRGKGIGVAIVDSGIQKKHPDVANRTVANTSSLLTLPSGYDGYGHGTFVAGVVGGDNRVGKRQYVGVAPESNLIDVKVTTATGASTESDVVAGLQWIYENHKAYNIRVVNVSLNASGAQSYHTSPLAAACEILWFNGIVVVTSAGNRGEGKIYPPANDPFVITVGATDDMGTERISDDAVAHFSAYGTTVDGFAKPDLVAPGRHIVAPMASAAALLPLLRPEMVVNDKYMRMSGTSFSAPVVSGAIALLLEAEPDLTPDQVKYRLMATANRNWAGYNAAQAGAGYLDVAAAVQRKTHQSANTDLPISQLLTTGSSTLGQFVGTLLSLNWDSVSWSTVSWSTVSWSTVSWSTVSWSSDYIEKMMKRHCCLAYFFALPRKISK
ncbi:MAG: S8 family peptidase [Caldilineaceae bacterium]